MPNPFVGSNRGLTAPGGSLVKITADDSNDLPAGTCRALLVGSPGNADLVDADGNACTAVPLQQGYNPIGVTRLKATNLTAANIWAIY